MEEEKVDGDRSEEKRDGVSGGDAGRGGTKNDGSQRLRYDTLTIFQACPLVYRNPENGELHPIEDVLDFEHEREVIVNSLGNAAKLKAEVEPIFKTGTTQMLGDILAGGSRGGNASRALHFSCHGGEDFLFFEDGRGGTHAVAVDHLPEFISAGAGEIRFVFIAACFSRAAGEAFLKAGARHVVCCHHEEQMMDIAVTVFCRAFYTALACDRTLRDAFEIGRQVVKMSSEIPNAEKEMNKILLLPEEGGDHNVPIFYVDRLEKPKPSCPLQDDGHLHWILEQTPQKFIGREIDIYHVLCELERARLVRLTGPEGVGKRSLAAAVCQYIKDRSKSFGIKDVIWLPLMQPAQKDELASSFHLLFDRINILRDKNCGSDGDFCTACNTIIEGLQDTKALIVIDSANSKGGLNTFLQHLLRKTKNVKVILVCRAAHSFLHTGLVESRVQVGSLCFRHSITFFGTICPHLLGRQEALTPEELLNILVSENEGALKDGDDNLSARSKTIFRIIGGGIPGRIIFAAKEIKIEQFNQVLKISKLDLSEYTANVALMNKLEKIADELHHSSKKAIWLKILAKWKFKPIYRKLMMKTLFEHS